MEGRRDFVPPRPSESAGAGCLRFGDHVTRSEATSGGVDGTRTRGLRRDRPQVAALSRLKPEWPLEEARSRGPSRDAVPITSLDRLSLFLVFGRFSVAPVACLKQVFTERGGSHSTCDHALLLVAMILTSRGCGRAFEQRSSRHQFFGTSRCSCPNQLRTGGCSSCQSVSFVER